MTNVLNHSANLQSRINKGKLSQEKFEKAVSLLIGTLDYESFRAIDMVIEVSAIFSYRYSSKPTDCLSYNVLLLICNRLLQRTYL